MKKVLVLVAVMMASQAFAGAPAHEKMGDALGLSTQQKSQMQELRQKHKDECKTLRVKQKAEMRAILTPEQAVKFDAMKEDKMKEMHDKHPRMDKKAMKKMDVKK